MNQILQSNQEAPVILITGGAKRIGAHIVSSLHKKGYRVIIHYRHSFNQANELCRSLNQVRPDSAAIVKADFEEFFQIEACVQSSFAIWQRLDGIVNNCSSFFPTEVGHTTFIEWHQLMSSNLVAPYFLIQSALFALQQSSLAQVVNLIDIYSQRPLKGYAVYSIAKAGLVMLTKSLAKELGPNIKVNAISPGITLWPESQSLTLEQKEELIEKSILKNLTSLEDISNTVLYLLAQSSMTGEVIHLDCGRLLK